MTDQPEVKFATEEVKADFEGHKLSGPEKLSDVADVKSTLDDDGPDFEGHRLSGPDDKIAKITKISKMS